MLTVALALLAALHIGAAALDRDPFGPTTRWTTLAAAAAFATAGFVGGAATIDGTPVVELVSLPVALTVLAGSAAAQWRGRHRTSGADADRSDAELVVWLAGLVIAVLPSIVAPVEPVRTWLVIVVPLAAALIGVLRRCRSTRSLRTCRRLRSSRPDRSRWRCARSPRRVPISRNRPQSWPASGCFSSLPR